MEADLSDTSAILQKVMTFFNYLSLYQFKKEWTVMSKEDKDEIKKLVREVESGH